MTLQQYTFVTKKFEFSAVKETKMASSLFLDWRDIASVAKTDDSASRSLDRVCTRVVHQIGRSNVFRILYFALFCCMSSWAWWQFCDIWAACVITTAARTYALLRINWRLLDNSFVICSTRDTTILYQTAVSYTIETASSYSEEEEVVQPLY